MIIYMQLKKKKQALLSQSVRQSVSQSVISQLSSQLVSQSGSQSFNQSVSLLVNQSVTLPVSQSGSLILSQSVSDAGCISHNVDCMSDLTHSQFYISSSSMWKSWELWTKFQPQRQQNSNFFMVFKFQILKNFEWDLVLSPF